MTGFNDYVRGETPGQIRQRAEAERAARAACAACDHVCPPPLGDAAVREALDAWRAMRATPATDATGSTREWVRAYTLAERLLDRAARTPDGAA